MGRPHAIAIAVLGILVALGWFLMQRSLDPDRRDARVETERPVTDGTGIVGGPVSPAPPVRADPDAVVRGEVVYAPRDVEILAETMAWAAETRLDTADIGTIVVRLGERFVGSPYTPHLLDPPGPERLVVNLREFDCVTYVESILAMARMVRDGRTEFGDFTAELRRIRYRDGRMDEYPSRLHYFSEWIRDNERKGIIEDITRGLGGEQAAGPINFMSTNASAYAQLSGRPERIEAIRAIERRLSAGTRHVIPEGRIEAVVDGIRNGDIIAATSTVQGLDIAHTGFALRIDGRLHLMHAPLVGSSVEISTRPMAARIVRIDGQDGIMVARPL